VRLRRATERNSNRAHTAYTKGVYRIRKENGMVAKGKYPTEGRAVQFASYKGSGSGVPEQGQRCVPDCIRPKNSPNAKLIRVSKINARTHRRHSISLQFECSP